MRKSKTVLDSGFHAVDFGFHALDSSRCQWNLDSSIQIVRGIPDSLSRIPDSKAQDFRFHRPTFHALRNPNSLTWRELKPSLSVTPESRQTWSGPGTIACGCQR